MSPRRPRPSTRATNWRRSSERVGEPKAEIFDAHIQFLDDPQITDGVESAIEDDHAGEFGLIYLPVLQRIRDLWLELEPLVDATLYDDIVAPTELQICLSDGLGDADAARLDIQWSELGMYSFHYADTADINWRFDRHPNTHSPEIHFHPPSDEATTAADPSCIDVAEVSLVTRAVHAMWRAAYDKKRFKCQSCSHQDHADRSASVNIAVKGIKKLDWTVPALNSLPQVRKVRRQASGAVDAPTVTHDGVRGYQTDGVAGVSD